MTTDKLEPLQSTVDFSETSETIRSPGHIQPHGLLFVLAEPDFTIVQISENVDDVLGISATNLLREPITQLIGTERLRDLQSCLEHGSDQTTPLKLTLHPADGPDQCWNAMIHRAPSGEVVLELEPWDAQVETQLADFFPRLQSMLKQIQQIHSLQAMAELIVTEVKQLTSFDRVMVYRFNPQGDGTVIAEVKQPQLAPLLGLRYPHTDIPMPARQLYQRKWLRLLRDINAVPAPLITTTEPATDDTAIAQLDMSDCSLRSHSPCHGSYLQNMDVMASMGISLLQEQKLWGLIVCHHATPKFVPYEIRAICEFMGHLMSTELIRQEANETLEYQLQLQTIQARLIENLAGITELVPALQSMSDDLLSVVGASGAAIVDGDTLALIGSTPTEAATLDLLDWVRQVGTEQFTSDQLVTNALPQQYPAAADYQAVASGLLAIVISPVPARYILWFRPELRQTVVWGRDVDQNPVIEVNGHPILSPQQSFAAWQETVQGQSAPWLACECHSATGIKAAIVEIVLRQANELATLNLELQRSNSELSAFAYVSSHDLQEPLRKIRAFGDRLKSRSGDRLDAKSQDYLRRMLDASQRAQILIDDLLTFSRVTSKAKPFSPVDLEQLISNVINDLEILIEQSGGTITVAAMPPIDADAFQMRQLFQNLLTNALKFSREAVPPIIAITATTSGDLVQIAVSDNGIGFEAKYRERIFQVFQRLHDRSQYEGTGIGLAICRKIVERHQGSLIASSQIGQGSTFTITLPRHPTAGSSHA
ncbi:GAF domain-containing protein [filamentous cyanobacterium LEGE 11480]|uniref:histidine kinase n=1 Tax=Romeriopsis navalis LEGE 11480 TaxID=2777977 RepID=A0A928VK06_9CYAN|nr:ATP-binding protein [Romeriopsis navalis]MBE9029153.1 GAF domain-containing protein [Romeriopsis navalis LEGE 11480]